MTKKFYVIYEDYTDFNLLEGEWTVEIKEFDFLSEAKEWLDTSHEAKECRTYRRKLIGVLTHI